MATKKKTTKKASAKKTGTKKASAKKTGTKKASAKRASTRKPARVLSPEERQKLLKPRENFEDTADRVLREWEQERQLRVPGLTLGKLRSLMRIAEKAEARESAVLAKYERTLTPLSDARRLAHHDAFKALLLIHKAVKLHASVDPGISQRFAFLTEALTTNDGSHPATDDEAREAE
ncbi:hypothetical protein [Sandaracinus amylolyticus]|uniref:hypothetical protein n=1 Tax=Sandaracinus amylolyticus TaxID=927083 RepID=UPI001F3B096A|nr:hypothetical protein [Sandaracinus amylolyticus]UJR85848.1 Hypothetical protein I5071_79280 [Sandaracinus amylolyticus]